jgi:hypothetical protein
MSRASKESDDYLGRNRNERSTVSKPIEISGNTYAINKYHSKFPINPRPLSELHPE